MSPYSRCDVVRQLALSTQGVSGVYEGPALQLPVGDAICVGVGFFQSSQVL